MRFIQIGQKIFSWVFTVHFIFLLPLFFSCYRDVIDLDLQHFDPQVVIEGVITNQQGPYLVKVSKAADLNQLDNFPMVSGAEVLIRDYSGYSETLIETEPGIYETRTLRGVPGRSYTLQVLAEGKEYAATSQMPQPLSLDYIFFQNYGSEYALVCAFTDRKGKEDFCRIKVYKNGELADRYLYQGKYSDGEQIIIDDFEVEFHPNDQVRVEFITITEEIFIYLSMLDPQEGGGDYNPEYPEFMAVSLANPRSNINNNALGYFSAQSVTNYTRVVR